MNKINFIRGNRAAKSCQVQGEIFRTFNFDVPHIFSYKNGNK